MSSRIRIPESECRFVFAKSSGPGGQNVNRVATKVQVFWSPQRSRSLTSAQKLRLTSNAAIVGLLNSEGQIVLQEQRARSQNQNRERVLQKLHAVVAQALQTRRRRMRTAVSRAQREVRIEQKRKRARTLANRRKALDD